MSSSAWKSAFFVGLALTASALVPGERVLGRSLGIVYLHGAWVWTALTAFGVAALAGLLGWIRRSDTWHRWSMASGQTGAIFWVTYLPLSLWAMRSTWGGLYLLEPRWRLGVDFALASVTVQAAILLIGRPRWASALNLGFFAALTLALATTPSVLHPASPVFSSTSMAIKLGFLTILGACWGAAYFLTRLLQARRV